MSYDISLNDPITGETLLLETKHQMTGGSYAVGGTEEAWLNVTCNYARWYYKDGIFPEKDGEKLGIRTIYGMTGAESIPILKAAIYELRDLNEELPKAEISEYMKNSVTGYWLPTKANAIRPLTQLLALAQMRPDGVWEGN